MSGRQQIDKAIGAHGLWKSRLREAIDTGESDFTAAVVKTDNSCDFGQWLHNTITLDLKATPQYRTILSHHAEFHMEAARILQMALAGKKADADACLSAASRFSAISAALTTAMMEWKRTIPE